MAKEKILRSIVVKKIDNGQSLDIMWDGKVHETKLGPMIQENINIIGIKALQLKWGNDATYRKALADRIENIQVDMTTKDGWTKLLMEVLGVPEKGFGVIGDEKSYNTEYVVTIDGQIFYPRSSAIEQAMTPSVIAQPTAQIVVPVPAVADVTKNVTINMDKVVAYIKQTNLETVRKQLTTKYGNVLADKTIEQAKEILNPRQPVIQVAPELPNMFE
jgi:hypothetical protein